MPVGYMYREQPRNENDSGWWVLSGEESQEYLDDASNFAFYNAATIVALDPSIAPFLAAAPPAAFQRGPRGTFVKADE
jgi:hypothetical protein